MTSVVKLTDGREKLYLSCAETAVYVRKALKKHFPGMKFSVRSKTYSGGASIDVSWTDGPTSGAVDEVIKRFAGATFDGMIDLKSYVDGEFTVEDEPEQDGQLVSWGADYVFAQRNFSPEFKATLEAEIAAVAGEPFDATKKMHAVVNWDYEGDERVPKLVGPMVDASEWGSDLFWRWASGREA
jgi:Large polyvalent protein associated domain 29